MLATQSFIRNIPVPIPNVDRPGDGVYVTDSYTSLLLHSDTTNGSTTFTDSSGNSISLSGNGQAQHSTAQAKLGGSSILMDGSGDHIDAASHADFNVAGDNFTIDFWIYPNSAVINQSGVRMWFVSGTQDHNVSMAYNHGSAPTDYKLEIWASTAGSSWNLVNETEVMGTSGSLTANEWQHLALVRYGDLWQIYRNGTQEASVTKSGSVTSEMGNGLKIGSHGGNSYNINGYIDEFRFSKGIARWTSSFTVY